ncbi:MAG: hypothetical protein KDE55_01260 [Novosphingobium sp.]|nr:hypothetical protein [Novosphingobium sp.]
MSDGWEALNAAIAEARALVAAEAPDEETAAEGEAYVTRVVAAGLGSATLGHLFHKGGLALALPVYGGPNPDYIMRHTGIDPTARYRLEGRLNGSERVGVGLYSIGRNGAPLIAGYTAFDRGNCASDGSFSLEIAADATGEGGLAVPPDARILMFRLLHRDDSEPARLDLVGAPPQRGPALMTGTNDGALGFVANSMRANVREYLKWMAAARSLPNRLDIAPPELAETVQGDGDTQYFLGGFDLSEGEWLEVTMPPGLAGYWSLHAYNFWYEHLQTPGVHDRNAVPGPDGKVTIGVGPSLPDHAQNRIDTVGRRKSAFVCRIVGQGGAVDCPEATVRTLA